MTTKIIHDQIFVDNYFYFAHWDWDLDSSSMIMVLVLLSICNWIWMYMMDLLYDDMRDRYPNTIEVKPDRILGLR